MLKLIKITPNFHKVTFGDTKIIYFSYEEPIAFFDGITNSMYYTLAASVPNAGTTTMKHIKNARGNHLDASRQFGSHEALRQAIINHF